MVVLTSLGPPESGIKHTEERTKVYVNTRSLGSGTLYISESRISWVGNSENNGFSLEYPHVVLHAISKDPSSFHSECLYLMIDVRLLESEETTPTPSTNSEASEDEESLGGMTEIRFVPQNKGQLQAMFNAMSECQALHPDPEASEDEEDPYDEDEEDENGPYEDAEEEMEQ